MRLFGPSNEHAVPRRMAVAYNGLRVVFALYISPVVLPFHRSYTFSLVSWLLCGATY